jgi:hypothetical protein
METRYFSVEEANELLADIEPLMERLLERRTKVVESRQQIYQLLAAGDSDFGGPAASELVQDFVAIERLARKIRSHGCIIKDLNNGLVDFLSKRDGREIYLCWRYGEPRVEFFHELHMGFKGRQHI